MTATRSLRSGNAMLLDGAIALALATLGIAAVLSGADRLDAPPVVVVPLLLLETLPIAVRRRFPAGALLVILAAAAVHILILSEGEDFPSGLAVLVALYTVGERLDRRRSLALLALTTVSVTALMLLKMPMPAGLQAMIQTVLVCGVAWLVGDAARIRGLYTAAVEERARLLERERAEQARIAVLEERERIARDLHDAVAHHVSVVVIQAGAALRAADRRPADVRTALEAIGASGRKALTDMRRMLAMLGDQTDAPRPGLDQLGELLEEVRAAGLAVELSIRGQRPTLDPELDASAYRIIQESLTNALKHAGEGGRARVEVAYGDRGVSISVDDERGAGVQPPVEGAHDGRGLAGMRERVALFRGTFAAEPTASGFRVRAELPTGDAP